VATELLEGLTKSHSVAVEDDRTIEDSVL
jgi:hypothetical protein